MLRGFWWTICSIGCFLCTIYFDSYERYFVCLLRRKRHLPRVLLRRQKGYNDIKSSGPDRPPRSAKWRRSVKQVLLPKIIKKEWVCFVKELLLEWSLLFLLVVAVVNDPTVHDVTEGSLKDFVFYMTKVFSFAFSIIIMVSCQRLNAIMIYWC